MLMNDEQRAAYREALMEERRGYEAQVQRCVAEGDKDGKAYYENLLAQVDAEHERSLSEESEESSDDSDTSKKRSSSKKSSDDAASE